TVRRARQHRIHRHLDGGAARGRCRRDADTAGHYRSGRHRSGDRADGHRYRRARPRRSIRVRAHRCAGRPAWTGAGAMKTALALLLGLARAVPAAAEDDSLSIRPFALGTVQSFAAIDTFDAVFGRTYEPFFGGGVQVLQGDYFLDLTASRLNQTGQRAFFNGGQKFRLGIPLTAKITPLEATAGYRHRLSPRGRPYGAAGIGHSRHLD